MHKPSRLLLAGLLALPLTAFAQYVGKVDQGKLRQPILRATAVYEYTGALDKPDAARLVPVVVWDGSNYQPGGLYLAQPEPLTVAPGTQYILEKSGIPTGDFNVASAAKLNNAWIAMGRYAAPPPEVAPPKLAVSKQLPAITGGSGKGKADQIATGPVLKNKTAGQAPPATASTTPKPATGEPTLHRRDQDTTQTSSSGNSSANTDQPTLHRRDTASTTAPASDPDRPRLTPDAPTQAPLPSPNLNSPSPDRPTLHKRSEAATAAPNYDRPHLRYGVNGETEKAVLPTELKNMPNAGPGGTLNVHQLVAISDTAEDDPHPYLHAFASPTDQAKAEQAMQALAVGALADTGHATFGPAAKQNAAKTAQSAKASFGPATHSRARARKAATPPQTELQNAQFKAFELSYGSTPTYVYSAQTGQPAPDRRYVTVIAQPDFYGKLKPIFTQTTSTPMLRQSPALHLIDAVDTNGDHRAELLFDEQTTAAPDQPAESRRFAIYRVLGGTAEQVYATTPGAIQ